MKKRDAERAGKSAANLQADGPKKLQPNGAKGGTVDKGVKKVGTSG